MGLREIEQADRKLIMLRALAAENDYAIRDIILKGLLVDYGYRTSIDTIRSDIAWLHEQGLVTTSHLDASIIATITERGADVASGAAIVPGVRRPRPGE